MHPTFVSLRAGTKTRLAAVMPITPGRVDHVEGLLRAALDLAPDIPLSVRQQARLLRMRERIRDLLKPAEAALLGRARSTTDARTQDACIKQQRRLWAIYDPSAPALQDEIDSGRFA